MNNTQCLFDEERISKQIAHLKEAGPYRPDKWDVLTWFSEIIDGNEWNILFLRQQNFLVIIQEWQS